MPIPIIMKIGSAMGPGGLASLQAGVQMIGALGRKVAETVKDLDRFAQVARKLAGPIDEADAATKGMIDTLALMVQRNKIAEAGLELTAKQYRIVAVAAVKMAQATGQDATAAFERLTKSILMGSSRSLKEFGVDLEETEDQVLAQKESIEKLTEKYGETTVEIETVTRALYRLDNAWGTLTGTIYKNGIPGLDGTRTSVNDLSQALEELTRAVDNNENSWAILGTTIAGTLITAVEGPLRVLKYALVVPAVAEAVASAILGEKIDLIDLALQNLAEYQAGLEREGKRGKSWAEIRAGLGGGVSPDVIGQAGPGEAPEPKKKAGGGKPKPPGSDWEMKEFSMEEAEARPAGTWMEEFSEAEAGHRESFIVGEAVDIRMIEERERMAEEAHEAQRERFAARMEWAIIEAEAEQTRTDQRIADIERLTGAVEGSASRQAIAQRMIAGAANLAGDATTASIQAIVHGSKGFKAALWNMVSQQLASIAATEAVLGARDTAAAISYLTTPFTAALAPGKFVAAGKHFAVAALAGAGAVGAGLSGKARGGGKSAPSLGSGGMVYGGGPGGGPAQLDRGGGGQVTYNIVLKDGAETMFDVISDEDERRRRAGQSTLGQAA